jgi:hypothetical protein
MSAARFRIGIGFNSLSADAGARIPGRGPTVLCHREVT